MIKTVPDWTTYVGEDEQHVPIGQDVVLSDRNTAAFVDAVLEYKKMIPRCCFVTFGKKRILLWDQAPDMVIPNHDLTLDQLESASLTSPLLTHLHTIL
jgi:hypothetical protein